MSSLQVFLIILLFSTISSSRNNNKKLEPYSRYKSVNCDSSNVTLSSFKCFIKAYSRTNTTANFLVELKRPIFKVNCRFDLRFKSLSNSQRSIINSTAEICSILNGTGTNLLYKWFVGMMPELETLIHPCPYQGLLTFKNLSVNLKMIVSSFPAGNYIGIMTYFDDFDSNIITIKYVLEIISNDRKDF